MSGCVDLVDDKLDHMLWKAAPAGRVEPRADLKGCAEFEASHGERNWSLRYWVSGRALP